MAVTELAPSNSLLTSLLNQEVYQPASPLSLEDAGLSESLVDSLICKSLMAKGRGSGRAIAEVLGLPFGLLEPRLQALRSRTFVAHASSAQLNDYTYVLT